MWRAAHMSDGNESLFGLRAKFDDDSGFGKASLADGGTLYLEGVEALSLPRQRQLLQFLNEAMAKHAAGQQPEPDVRVISSMSQPVASNPSDPPVDVELEQRLAQHRLNLPSLAERRGDIVAIAEHIVARRSRSAGKAVEGLSDDAKKMLENYSWPGNIRELQTVVERAVLLASGRLVDIPEELLRRG